MHLYILLSLALLSIGAAEPLPRYLVERQNQSGLGGPYRKDYRVHYKVVKDVRDIPPDGPITSKQSSVLGKDLAALHKGLQVDYAATNNSNPLTVKDSSRLSNILNNTLTLGMWLFDDLVERQKAFNDAGAHDFVCDNITQACEEFQRLLEAFIAIAQGKGATLAKRILEQFKSKCAETLANFGCGGT